MALEKVNYSDIEKLVWDEFCIHSNSAWFQHTTEWIRYTQEMYGESNCQNESFAVVEDSKILAISVAMKELREEKNKSNLTMAGFPTVYPAFEKNLSLKKLKTVEKYTMERVFEIKDIGQYQFFVSPLIQNFLDGSIRVNPLLKFGFTNTSISTNIIDISQGRGKLFKNMFKGCRTDIKHALKNEDLSTFIIDKENYNEYTFQEFKNIHFEAAGRKTRSDITWDIQREWIINGLAILGICKYKDSFVSGIFINKYKNNYYYQVGATRPEHMRIRGIGQLLQWSFIEYLINAGGRYYELGWNWYPNFSQEIADEKMLAISSFKRSFGGDIYPLFRGEKFRSSSFMEEEYKKRLITYQSYY